jgi:chorismate mutase
MSSPRENTPWHRQNFPQLEPRKALCQNIQQSSSTPLHFPQSYKPMSNQCTPRQAILHKKKLQLLRVRMSRIDAQIITLIQKRLALAIKAKEHKKQLGLHIKDTAREKIVLLNVKREASQRKLPAHDLVLLFQKIITMCRKAQYQRNKELRSR